MRRLITLISAGRNRTIVIRRELPLTKTAGWEQSPYRIKDRRVLLSVCPAPAHLHRSSKQAIQKLASAAKKRMALPPLRVLRAGSGWSLSRPREACRREALTGAGAAALKVWEAMPSSGPQAVTQCMSRSSAFTANCPDEAEQFPADRRHDLRLVLASASQLFVSGAEPPLALSRQYP